MPVVLAAAPVVVGVGVVFVLVGVGIAVYAVLERRWVAELADRAVTADARVDRVKAMRSATSTERRHVMRYRAVVDVRMPDGTEHRATTRWPTSHRPEVGAVVRVRYDPERPSRVVFAEGPGSVAPGLAVLLVIAAVPMVMGYVAISLGRAAG